MRPCAQRPGQTYKEVILRDGRRAVLRAPDWHDLDDFGAFINELVEERAEIPRVTKVTLDEEAGWLGRRLAAIKKGILVALVAEIDTKLVASSAVGQRIPDYSEHSHVGEMGVIAELEYLGKFIHHDPPEHQIVAVFLCRSDNSVQLDSSEADRADFLSRQEIEKIVSSENITPWFGDGWKLARDQVSQIP